MSMALVIMGVAFAALAVWLAVRIVNRRERWAKWTAVALVAYPLSFGPAVWLAARGTIPETAVKCVYWPLLCQRVHLPNSWGAIIQWYGSFGIPSHQAVVFMVKDLEGDTLSASFGSDPAPEETD
jgi:hypothetical protein